MAEIDRISNLPDELISEIVSRLSVEEAATTCVSSKRWRDVFALITRLEFDHSCEYTLEQHNKFVDNALRACRSERITMFRLRILINQSYVPMEYKRVNHWMSFALSRGVKHLEVVAFLIDHDKLPLALFECQTLETLTLVLNVNFEVPSTYNLPNLKVLCLHFASFRDEDFITRLVSRSPLLERLDLLGIRECFQHINDVISAPFLTTLYINLLMFRENQRNTSKLLLDAPNLKYLDYSLSLESQYCIGDLNSLVGAKLNMPLNEVRLFRSMSNVRRLHLGSTCMKLNCAWSHSYHQVVLEMLHASPVLETIFFEDLNNKCNKVERLQEVDNLNKSEAIPFCLESHLKRIEINIYSPWSNLEQAMVKYFLRWSLVLEELVITYPNMYTLAERILLEREVQRLPKGSSNYSIKVQSSSCNPAY
ncbi:F-box/LRR-repeat protein At2g42730-like [Chenopodium quinoa]|uniref:F-box/LRR-repeat protein At2g42730-like n=1 Tax=Chenopodium quinoa TaxID=63459 RepID=UPI000B792D31|nr:F-box/LRR-repeat protein At2g42730-like [Chenopodium quinoa]